MFRLFVGILLIIAPFLLISRFEDRKKAFFYVLSGLIFFILFISVFTQLLHIFTYSALLVFFIILDVSILSYIYRKNRNLKRLREEIFKIRIDWMLVLIVAILFLQLYSVHYNYAGTVTSVTGNKNVNNMKIIYPYYSDEWVAVSLIKYSINTKSLPFANPLFENQVFNNLEFGFHSFLSGIFLFLGLNPLNDYSKLSIFFGVFICVLSYFLLRLNGIGKLNSAIASLSIPFIVNGVNLPGIWYLMPLTIGIVCLLLGFIFISMNSRKESIFMGFLVLLFYPPLFVFYTLSIITYFIFDEISKKEKIKFLGIYIGVCFLVFLSLLAGFFIIKNYSWNSALNFIFSKIYYKTFTQNAIPSYAIWKIIPIPSLLLGFLGILTFLRKKLWLAIPVFAGLIYWIIYSRVLWRFVIEYQRDVVVTSILIVIFSGFGFEYLFNNLNKVEFVKKHKISVVLQVCIFILLIIFSFYYTSNNKWENLKLKDLKTGNFIMPASPATNYLIEDDLRLFENITQKRFLAVPWKGLVIGTATGNYPLESKPSTITNKFVDYFEFIAGDCSRKNELAKKNKMNYVYSTEFKCDRFNFIGKSIEGFYLYEFKG